MPSLADIRTSFIDYFVENDHKELKSSNLVPSNDATLLFTNSGMVQFKDYLIGNLHTNDKRVVTSQKCLRAGGKHNDLENVGYTARHHTFFEMLGNFSFGDYFKEQAILLAWNLLTKNYGISKEKLLITIYHDDEESFKLWKKIAGLPESKIIRIASSDNFWQMGDFGPCGPCSEIFYDYGDKYQGGPPGSKDQDGDRFIEIWNLVFMQFEKLNTGEMVNLVKPSIDTGMGLERIAALMQGVHDNYDTDLIKSIICQITILLKRNKIIVDLSKDRNSLKVIADHIRSMGFLIAEGVMPSNEGRGYVLRRIMRRAMRHAYHLGVREPFLFKLSNHFIDLMSDHFSELNENREFINDTILFEEQRFQITLDRGLKLLNKEIADISNSKIISGKFAYKLYDTYGFPIDLTTDILKDLGINLKLSEYEDELTKRKVQAKKSWLGTKDKKFDKVWYSLSETLPATEFLGYTHLSISAEVLAIVAYNKDKLDVVSKAKAGQEILFVTNQTSFYPESGGQIGDTGFANLGSELKLEISDCQKVLSGIIYHKAKIIKGVLKTGDSINLSVDNKRREKIAASHSATHLLHRALRQVLGDHIVQKGSLVADSSFRFDFAHNKPLSDNEILTIENIVNSEINNNSDVKIKNMNIDEAKKIGATALFGEKYDEEVRVVFMAGANSDWSIELCGGCHVASTGNIQLFKIISVSSVAAGIRRIVAVTAKAALELFQQDFKLIENLSQTLKVKPIELVAAVNRNIHSNKLLEEKIKTLENKLATDSSKNVTIKEVGAHHFAYLLATDHNKSDLKNLLDQLKSKIKSGLAVLSNLDNKKNNITILIASKGLDNEKFNLAEVAQLSAKIIGGRGGGKEGLYQIGGKKIDKLQAAIDLIHKNFKQSHDI